GWPGEAVPARVRATPVTVDGVLERQRCRIGNLVQRGLAQHLVKCDAVELRRVHAPDKADALQPGQRAVIGPDVLAVPSHESIRTPVRYNVNPGQNAVIAGLVANTPAVSGLSFKLVHRDV